MIKLLLALSLAIPVAAGTPDVAAAIAYGKLPLSFTANHGQTDARVKYVSRGKGYALYLTGDEAVLALHDSILRMSFTGANKQVAVSALEELPGKANYFTGSDPATWRTDIPTYARIR